MFKTVEKAILIGKGVEGRVIDLLNSLAEEGEKRGSVFPSKEEFENSLVEGGVEAAKKVLSSLKEDKAKLEKKVEDVLQGLVEKIHLASKEDVELVEKMASKAREQVDKLEKKIKELEKKID